jgi:hypothetical protein
MSAKNTLFVGSTLLLFALAFARLNILRIHKHTREVARHKATKVISVQFISHFVEVR